MEFGVTERKLAVLVDGSSFIYRAFFALPQLTRGDGQAVGAIYGFCSMLMSLLDKHESDLFFVVLDSGRRTFRSEMYSEYKSHRAEVPEELKSQFPLLRDACAAFGIPTVAMQGFEADDLIATYASELSSRGFAVRIVASDKDLMQLVDDNVSLFDPIKSKVIGVEDVFQKFGVSPSQVVHFQALVGDSSDNIPGVSGIGPVTASKLINQFKTLEGIYENIDEVQPLRIREKLIAERQNAEISLKLATLVRNVEVDQALLESAVDYDHGRAGDFLKLNDFSSLLKRLDRKNSALLAAKRRYVKIATSRELKNFIELSKTKKISIFCGSHSKEGGILALCSNSTVGYCFFSFDRDGDLFSQNENLSLEDMGEALEKYLRSPEIIKIGIRSLGKYFPGVDFVCYEDLSLMAYLLHGPIGDLVGDIFRDSEDPICGLSFRNLSDINQVCKVCEMMQDYYASMLQSLEENQLLEVYRKIDLPLVNVLKGMEESGILVSSSQLNRMAEIFSEKIKELEASIFDIVQEKFNIGSVKQLADIFFNRLNLPQPRKKGTLDVESLEELSVYSPVPGMVIEWRKFSKLLSNYTHRLCDFINPATGRLHSSLSMTSTVTGRLSSSNPNLQNIPVRTEHGKLIKKAFIAREGCRLISFDYSQIELRVLAHVADIGLLKESFLASEDVHATTAAGVFGVPPSEVTEKMRSQAKTINFGIIYGMSAFRLSHVLGVPLDQANSYIAKYFEKFSEYEDFRRKTVEFARKHGYVKTISGRRCYTKDINSRNFQLRSFGERQAVNAVIQGSASDIVKIAMIEIHRRMKDLHSSMLLQIHDELVFETEDGYVDEAISVIKNLMETAMTLSVPLLVNAETGNHLK